MIRELPSHIVQEQLLRVDSSDYPDLFNSIWMAFANGGGQVVNSRQFGHLSCIEQEFVLDDDKYLIMLNNTCTVVNAIWMFRKTKQKPSEEPSERRIDLDL